MRANLLQKDAELRAHSVESGITYRLYLNLQKGDNFSGMGHYTFNLKQKQNVFLDFCGKAIDTLEINDHKITPEKISEIWKEGRLTLLEEHLTTEKPNQLIFTFSNHYYHDGNGIHTFIDADKSQYTYCQSEPFWINKAYPVFDQPDLKGKMSFVIQAPNDWSVISNMNPSSIKAPQEYKTDCPEKCDFSKLICQKVKTDFENCPEESRKVHTFFQTPLISTYLFNFVTGPFCSVSYEGEDGPSVPMTIYCRKSHKEYAFAQKRDIFLYCKEGIEFFNKFFQTPYPFDKYDFIFCPEFTVGAMEYPGAITFSDRFIFTETPQSNQISDRGRVIVHELAHMWFGNLVTMKWWNDLWLNESFADFACYIAMADFGKKLPFENSEGMLMFCLRKFWGYNDDQLITTHPISCEVTSTQKADSIFDGITYSKGAAVMKQLYFILGHEQFSDNLGRYFAKYQWKNATLEEFLKEMTCKDSVSFDMKKWNLNWIEKAGLNCIQAIWDSTKQGANELTIRQEAVSADHPTLRTHRIKVAFYKEDGTVGEVLTVDVLDAEITKIPFENKDYKAVLLNYEDWGFVKIEIDDVSLNFFKSNLLKIESWMSKLLIFRSLYEMIRDAKLKATIFLEMFDFALLEHLSQNPLIFDIILSFVSNSVQEFTVKKYQSALKSKLFHIIVELAQKEDRPAILRVLKTYLFDFAQDHKSINVLKNIFEEVHELHSKIKLTKVEKWTLLFKILRNKDFTKVQKEVYTAYFSHSEDSSDKKLNMLKLDAEKASIEEVQELWNRLSSVDRKMSFVELRYSLQGIMHSIEKHKQHDHYRSLFADVFIKLVKEDQTMNVRTFLENGLVHTIDIDFWIKTLGEILVKITDKNEYFEIALKKKIDNLERKKKVLALYDE